MQMKHTAAYTITTITVVSAQGTNENPSMYRQRRRRQEQRIRAPSLSLSPKQQVLRNNNDRRETQIVANESQEDTSTITTNTFNAIDVLPEGSAEGEGGDQLLTFTNDDSVSTTTNSTTNDNAFNSFSDFFGEMFDEMLDPLSNNNTDGNTTTTTDDEFLEEYLDGMFDPDSNSTNMTNAFTEVMEELMEGLVDEIFGLTDDTLVHEDEGSSSTTTTTTDDTLLPEAMELSSTTTVELMKESVAAPTTAPSNAIDSTTNSIKYPPAPPSPEITINTDENKGHDNNGGDEPLSPIKITTSPTMNPTPSPSKTQQSPPDEINEYGNDTNGGGETENDDDTIYGTYKNRPVGSSTIPDVYSSFTIVLGVLAAIIGMIFTAWQMSDNPDGIYASFCRLTLTCIQLVYRIITSPCRKFLPCCCSSNSYHHHHHLNGTNGYHEPYGHLPVSTMDYGYKDPSLELT